MNNILNIMKKIQFILPFLFIFSFTTNDFDQLQKVVGKTKYPFWISVPNTSEKLPILLFLHGKSLSGNNLERVKRYGVLTEMKKGRNFNAIVVAPQVASGSWDPDKILEVIEYVRQNYSADNKNLFVCGMSMGGGGTLRFASKYPEMVTAAVAICSNAALSNGCNLGKVPLWIQHGDKDIPVPVSESKSVFSAIKKCNPDADATLTIIKGGTHSSVEDLFHKNTIYDWMFKYIKN